MVFFTKQDIYNELRRQCAMQNGDGNATFCYLEGISQVDEKLFWHYKTRTSKQLCDLFWSDGASQEDYQILSDESYNWVLEKFLKCMKGKTPDVVIIDGDLAMQIEIQNVYLEAHRRLCAWHLLRNATTNISQPRFTQLFRQCMLVDIDIHEFEKLWDAMLDECNVREVEWIMDLHTKKYSWATSYIRGHFYA
ncbi:hypothetical protein AHAS_Ahas02G0166900 [Arachis hypogaea]